ncbi:transforming growth factor-beta receptor-associated protein 1 isoform X1 [Prionailurus viverrinus]|uniref:transforming growth factor-beta receptor-associated protein 1 isoform X1 n=1 Tax=Prionailurus viverrinus TaxID=61388 RepID=UPI001FF22312|nr:transforming growth factor-beta receptor-associated protein 1 isoform X1 [Prionailurus viverrinus]XP_047709933.1 transforming growth factor-beta receptor-associated protein 1 isoform X1 [Prionailurus viverrinus]XP_047709934.1 transforming growth factor-beta receptor-associated protein 1 isoform X1 [Prionailurus viverrinus]XP_047709936.1 transforming growth factor-beta receptor-associated protein 1 isoform X1 [Prionailurus viverrinus]XP_047709937.1 transforming growth factor-beta receptor-ass
MMSTKAFTLVSAVERELLVGDKEQGHIECVECCGKNLYVGTSDCIVYHFLLEERAQPAGTATFSATKQLHRHLGFRKPVSELRAASALNRLLVLCDNSITLVNMMTLEPVPSGARIKGAVALALNENPVSGDPFCVEVCIISVKRRTIQVFLVYEDRVQIVREVSTPEQPLAVAVDGHFLCLALTTQYIILNYNTGVAQDLFPYCSDEKRPIVKRIGRQEFLLAGPGGLGMFATVAGISQRAPVHWSENVIGAAICFPYVIALDNEFITVHSMLDQQQKQTLPFKEGHILQDFEGRVIVATSKGVYILVPLPLEKQIQDLLASRRVEEALVLAKGARRNIPKEKFQVMYRRILQQAGFIQFAQLQFLEAKELFRSGQLDVRELISLYPFLLPTSSSFTRSHPPLHEYADLNQLTQGDQEKMAKCKRFLMSYLNEVRSTEVANGYKEDIDTALLKLYAEADHDSLLDLLVTENSCLLTDSAAWLEKHKKYFALGLLYHYNNQDAAAVQLWVNIVNGDIHDSTRSDLYEYVVDFLTYSLDQELVWKYADWVLQKSEEVGVQVFTRRPLDEQQNSFNPDSIITCLKKYPKALVKYLEHLVMDRRLQKEEYHTHLALLYLDEVLQQRPGANSKGAEATETQAKLRHLLQKSDLYRVHFLIDRVRGAGLPMESAILHGKLEEHEEALRILVHELRDFSAAEDYCLWRSEGRDPPYRQRLFHTLLAMYLQPGPSVPELAVAATDLLNHHAAEFDAARVLQLLPGTWSVQLLRPFLTGAVRDSVHTRRTTQVAVGLAKSENLIYKYDKMKLKGSSVRLSDKKLCQMCQNPFREPVFVRYPNGGLVHTHCAAGRHTNPSPPGPGART